MAAKARADGPMSALDRWIGLALERGDPAAYDEFMEAIDTRLRQAMPRLRRIVGSYSRDIDVDEVLASGLERAILLLQRQYWKQDIAFRFDPAQRDLSFLDWLLCIIGRPGAGRRSGVFGATLVRQQREARRLAPIDDHPELVDSAGEGDGGREDHTALHAAVDALPPHEQFVLRVAFDLHDCSALTPDAVVRIARDARFEESELRKIRRRARILACGSEDAAVTMRQREIGHLLDVTERQVRRIQIRGFSRIAAALQEAA